jgi:nucleoside-diphosphate-sugar epimerase
MTQSPKATVLVTGGSGFVGSRVAVRLARLGYSVRAIVRRAGASKDLEMNGIEEIEGDFVDPGITAPAARGADIVVHCAATSGPDLDPVRRVNKEGTQTVVDATLTAGCQRYVQISTCSVYAVDNLDLVDEGAPLKAMGEPYGLTKAEADLVVLAAIPRGLRATIFRPGAILGVHPTSTWAVKVPGRVRDGLIKLKIDGEDKLPYVHVEDLVDGILLSLGSELAVGRIYNMADGHFTWLRFTDEIRGWFGTPPLERIPRSEVPVGAYWTCEFDARRVREELGYSPRHTYEEGMAEAGRYWRNELEATRTV